MLIEKGVFTKEEVRTQVEYMEALSYENGARLVARAWVDPAFKERLLSDTKATAAELGIDASGPIEFLTVENTEEVHNVIVCTLCSCYPRPILGRPPDWYKSIAYRSRVVVEPRKVLDEFGLELAENKRIAPSTTARRTSATSSSRSVRKGRKGWAKTSWPPSSRGTA